MKPCETNNFLTGSKKNQVNHFLIAYKEAGLLEGEAGKETGAHEVTWVLHSD